MKPGDLIMGKDHRHSSCTRLILEEYYEKSGDGLPPFRVFKMLENDGEIVEWGAHNIESYWEVIHEAR